MHDQELAEPPTSEDLEDKAKNSGPIGVEFRAVSFSYPDSGQPAVNEVSFTVEPGAQVALMGPSGAGKSTIADLLCLVLTPISGSISRINPSETSQNPKDFRGRVSYVPQKPGLVSGTIAQNVALAVDNNKVDRSAVEEAMRLAHLSELLLELPEGIDTPLGKLQDGLSGGQMQRLGLARALYSRPGLLVMDEATSALDAESEAEIQKALDEMRGRVTVVLIAHRLNTIQHADKVFLIQDGRLKDSGTFRDLVSRNPEVERQVNLMKVQE
jgi:ATP-binding cassette subfamily C protein